MGTKNRTIRLERCSDHSRNTSRQAIRSLRRKASADGEIPVKEISEQLRVIAIKENIKLASVQALGAINDFTVGVYKTDEKKYYSNSFQGYYEITSLTGTINTMDGEYYAHLHMSAGNQKGEVFGGHLNRAIVSATCELVITVIDGRVDRVHDEETGLNIFKFN